MFQFFTHCKGDIVARDTKQHINFSPLQNFQLTSLFTHCQ